MVIRVRFIPSPFHPHLNINNLHGMLNVVRVQWLLLILLALIKIKKWFVRKSYWKKKHKKFSFSLFIRQPLIFMIHALMIILEHLVCSFHQIFLSKTFFFSICTFSCRNLRTCFRSKVNPSHSFLYRTYLLSLVLN
jgi:hypothetical protein